MENNKPINPALLWMIVITNQLINAGVSTVSNGCTVLSQNGILRAPKKILPNARKGEDRRKSHGEV